MAIKIIARQVKELNKASAPGIGNEAAGGAVWATIPGGLIREARAGSPPPALTTTLPKEKNQNGLYLERGDNLVHDKLDTFSDSDYDWETIDKKAEDAVTWLTNTCGEKSSQWFIPAECTTNGDFHGGMTVYCSKDWCPVCGLPNSHAHNRRFHRWLERIKRMKSATYIVFTIPEDLRGNYRTKEDLRYLTRRVQGMLKRMGYGRGLLRWHWFGDKSHKWHPHLNVLVDGGWVNPATREEFKKRWRKILKTDVVSVHVSYKKNRAMLMQCLQYIVRPTFLDYNWDVEMALKIQNFRNMIVLGKTVRDKETKEIVSWGGKTEIAWECACENVLDEPLDKMEKGICPNCGGELKWGSALPCRLLDLVETIDYGNGYFGITRPPPPKETPETFALTVRRRCTQLEYRNTKNLHYDTTRWHDISKKRAALILRRNEIMKSIIEGEN